jgi:very-short-patch-repair endonuclease
MRIDDLLAASSGVLVLRDHPRSARTIQRAADRGVVAAVLPGVFLRPDHLGDPAARLLAVSVWSPSGVVCADTALQLFTGRPVSMPIRLRSPNRREPVPWLCVSRGAVPIEHRTRYRGIRTVTPAYAGLELATHDRGAAIFELLRRGLLTPDDLAATAAAFSGTPGNAERRRIATRAMGNPWSLAEARLHELLDSAGITGWVANRPLRIAGQVLYPDIWFRRQRVVVEFDGEAFHTSHPDFEGDRRRQNLLAAAGFRVVRITWAMLTDEPEAVVAVVRRVLAVS